MKKYLLALSLSIITIFSIKYNLDIKTPLINTINIEILDKELYTPTSYQEYEIYLQEAINIKNKFFISKEIIDKTTIKLQNKIDNLQIKPNKTPLINNYNNLININQDLYIPKSIPKLNQTIKNTEKIINNENALIEDVNNAIELIDKTIKELILKPDKTNLENIITKAKSINETKYTTKTYNELTKSIQNGEKIYNNENSTQEEVDTITSNINENLKNLKKTTKAIYEIKAVNYMLSNNHVGNEWDDEVYYNGKEVYKFEITAPYNQKYITLYSVVTEEDNIPDTGYGQLTILLKDGNTKKTKIYVTENRGRYYGNMSVWELVCTINIKERI